MYHPRAFVSTSQCFQLYSTICSTSPAPNPTTYPNNIPLRAQGPPDRPGPPPGDFHCFGCHSPDHMLGDCPRMAELAVQGVIIYDEITRKYYMDK